MPSLHVSLSVILKHYKAHFNGLTSIKILTIIFFMKFESSKSELFGAFFVSNQGAVFFVYLIPQCFRNKNVFFDRIKQLKVLFVFLKHSIVCKMLHNRDVDQTQVNT